MHRKFIALVIGTALAVTGLSYTPLHAQGHSGTNAILAGAARSNDAHVFLADHRKYERHTYDVTRRYGSVRDDYSRYRHQDHAVPRHHEARNHQDRRRKKSARGKRYSDWGYGAYAPYDPSYRYVDRGYLRGDNK